MVHYITKVYIHCFNGGIYIYIYILTLLLVEILTFRLSFSKEVVGWHWTVDVVWVWSWDRSWLSSNKERFIEWVWHSIFLYILFMFLMLVHSPFFVVFIAGKNLNVEFVGFIVIERYLFLLSLWLIVYICFISLLELSFFVSVILCW